MLKLHDIKELSYIPDYSLYILSSIILLIIILLIFFIILIYKYYKNRKKENKRKEYYKILNTLDLKKTKESAYLISKYSNLLCSNQRELKLMYEINEELEKYKYKKSVDSFSKEFLAKFETFRESIDV